MKKELRTCERCGMQFYVTRTIKRVTTCSECPIIVRRNLEGNKYRSRGHTTYDMALELVTIRIAFEMIEPLLKMDRRPEAVEVYENTKRVLESRKPNTADDRHLDMKHVFEILEEVEAPARDRTFHNFTEANHDNTLMETNRVPRTRGQ